MKSFLGICFLLFPAVMVFSAADADFKNPKKVRKMIDKVMEWPRQPKKIEVLYNDGVGHFDFFIPYNHFLYKTNSATNAHCRFTYHDGHLALWESISAKGKVKASELIWHNEQGAPVLTVYVEPRRDFGGYKYGVYDEAGRIKAIYRFNHFCQLQDYMAFTYDQKSTLVTTYDADSKPQSSSLHEKGRVYAIENGKKVFSQRDSRDAAIRRPMRYGLKPVYPLVEFPFSPAEVDLQEPCEVRKLFELTKEKPRQPGKITVLYGDGYVHVDRFIPTSNALRETHTTMYDQQRFTFHDGYLARWENISPAGELKATETIWHNDKGEPTWVEFSSLDGDYNRYRYGVFDEKGRIKVIYRFDHSFLMEDYDVFTYDRFSTRIASFDWESKPREVTLYEKGKIYQVENGKKRFLAEGDRKDSGHLTKLGLKPVYPIVD